MENSPANTASARGQSLRSPRGAAKPSWCCLRPKIAALYMCPCLSWIFVRWMQPASMRLAPYHKISTQVCRHQQTLAGGPAVSNTPIRWCSACINPACTAHAGTTVPVQAAQPGPWAPARDTPSLACHLSHLAKEHGGKGGVPPEVAPAAALPRHWHAAGVRRPRCARTAAAARGPRALLAGGPEPRPAQVVLQHGQQAACKAASEPAGACGFTGRPQARRVCSPRQR